MNARIEKVKKHFQDNRGTYIACGVTAVVAVAGTFFFVKNKTLPPQIISTIAPVFNNEVNPVIINMIERSTASKPVHLVGTNLYFNSLSEAARETGHTLSMISRNVNGFIPDVKGDVFELLEAAA
jgi:hypothetical protein